MKKILPFTGELDLTADTGAVEDNVDEIIQRLDMAMQVQAAFAISRLARSLSLFFTGMVSIYAVVLVPVLVLVL